MLSKKVIYLSSSIIPSTSASSVHIMKMCNTIARLGYTVTLIAPRIKIEDSGNSEVHETYNNAPNFSIIRLPYISPQNSKSRYIFSTVIYCLMILFVLLKKKPDLVYGRYLPGCFVSSLIKTPTIYESHSMIWKHKLELILFIFMVRFKALLNIVLISDALKQKYLQKFKRIGNKLVVAPDGADPFLGDEKAYPWPNREGCLQVGYIGNIYRGRGMRLIDKLSRAMRDIDFHVVGATEDEFSAVINRRPSINLYCHGRIPHSEIYKYLNCCDILLAPYQKKVQIYGGGGDTADFMSPLKIFEYMASGKAIIVSDLPVLHEVLNNQTAIFVHPEDYRQWVSAIDKLKNPLLRDKMGIAAKGKFAKHYTWEKRVQKIMKSVEKEGIYNHCDKSVHNTQIGTYR